MFKEETNNEKAALMSSIFNDLPPHYQDVVIGTIELLRKAKEIDKKQANLSVKKEKKPNLKSKRK